MREFTVTNRWGEKVQHQDTPSMKHRTWGIITSFNDAPHGTLHVHTKSPTQDKGIITSFSDAPHSTLHVHTKSPTQDRGIVTSFNDAPHGTLHVHTKSPTQDKGIVTSFNDAPHSTLHVSSRGNAPPADVMCDKGEATPMSFKQLPDCFAPSLI